MTKRHESGFQRFYRHFSSFERDRILSVETDAMV